METCMFFVFSCKLLTCKYKNTHVSMHVCVVYRIPYLAVARTFERIEEESKRLKIITILTNFFRSVIALSPEELVLCIYLCLNKVYNGI